MREGPLNRPLVARRSSLGSTRNQPMHVSTARNDTQAHQRTWPLHAAVLRAWWVREPLHDFRSSGGEWASSNTLSVPFICLSQVSPRTGHGRDPSPSLSDRPLP